MKIEFKFGSVVYGFYFGKGSKKAGFFQIHNFSVNKIYLNGIGEVVHATELIAI